MTPRRVLLAAGTLLGLACAATAGERPCLTTADLPAGAWRLVDDPLAEHPGASVLLLVRAAGQPLRVWFLPQKAGRPLLPVDARWRSGPPCDQLTVDLSRGVIACTASATAAGLLERYRWSLDGQALDGRVPSLIPVPGVERAGRFLVQGRGPDDRCSAGG